MTFEELENLFGDVSEAILTDVIHSEDIWISYSENSAPNWKIHDDRLFIQLFEKDDDFAKQLDSIFTAERGTVIKKSARTRIWEVKYIAYGPQASTIVNMIKDGVFREEIKRILGKNSVFLVPNIPQARRIPENFNGQWWNRWDLTLTFNQLHRLADEDVGRIESIEITLNK